MTVLEEVASAGAIVPVPEPKPPHSVTGEYQALPTIPCGYAEYIGNDRNTVV